MMIKWDCKKFCSYLKLVWDETIVLNMSDVPLVEDNLERVDIQSKARKYKKLLLNVLFPFPISLYVFIHPPSVSLPLGNELSFSQPCEV